MDIERHLKDYLLGSVSENLEEDISVRLITDERLANQLDKAENDLVEDYLDGLLSDEETLLFHRNFIGSQRRRELLSEVRMLRAAARNQSILPGGTDPVAVSKEKQSYFSFFSRPLFSFAGLLFVMFLGWLTWFMFIRDARTPLEVEYASLNRQDLADPSKTTGLSVISLISANFRDAASTATHPTSNLTDTILFRLALPVSEPEGAEFTVFIEKSGNPVFSVSNARVFRNAFGSELRFLAPKQVLQPGLYQIEIKGRGSRYENTSFQFRIE